LKLREVSREYVPVVLSIAITLYIYLPNLGNAFIGLDVPTYMRIMGGLDLWPAVKGSFTSLHGELIPGYYAPFASISLALDSLFGASANPEAKVTLTINLLTHCLNGGLVFQLLRRFSIPLTVSSLAALIFLIHPLQATSILWFAERKTLLSSAFYFLAIMGYVSFRTRGKKLGYMMSIMCFGAALLTKPVTVTLPAVLLVLEWLDVKNCDNDSGWANGFNWDDLKAGSKEALKYLSPYILLAGISVLATMQSEKAAHLPFSLGLRPLIAGAALWFYLSKIVIPINLVYIYPQWSPSPHNWIWYLPILGTIPLFALLYKLRNKSVLMFGCFSFLIPLIPALGFVTFGWYLKHSFVGDHFLYLSMMGAALTISYIIHGIAHWKSYTRWACLVLTSAWLVFLGVQTFNQTKVWNNSGSLWTHVIENNPLYPFAYVELALDKYRLGEYEESRRLSEKCLELQPNYVSAYYFVGILNTKLGLYDKAEEAYRKAISMDPEKPGPYNELGVLKMTTGNFPEAADLFKTSISKDPLRSECYDNLGAVQMQMKQYEEAAANFRKALGINRRSAQTWANLGFSMLSLNKSAEAMEPLKIAVELNPELADAQNQLAVLYFRAGNYDEAGSHAEKALSLNPDVAESKEIMSKLQRVQ
jgi:protein O-mannosyl-transferase